MRKLYEYKGSISGSGNNNIVLYVHGNDEVPPTRLTVPNALFEYIDSICGADSEERYYEKIFRYDNLLTLHEIEIPSQKWQPAKIITQENLTSKEYIVFGEASQMETPENELEPMGGDEYNRYCKFRREHEHDKFYYAN